MPSDMASAAPVRAEPPQPLPTSDREASGSVRTMDAGEIRRFLTLHSWGVLCTTDDGQPYAVPVSYGFDGTDVYVASGPGRKLRCLESHPAICLTICDVVDGSRWSSLVITGSAVPLSDLRGRLSGLSAIRRQSPMAAAPSARDLARAARATVFRLVPVEMSGRVSP